MSDDEKNEEEQKKDVHISDVKDDPTKTISFTKSFTVTWKNPETGVVNVGTFTATRPTIGTFGKIGVYRAKLNGGEQVDAVTQTYHAMLADLHYILTSTPDWWKPDEFYTASPLRDVWDHVVAWLNTFRRGVG